MYGDIRSGKVYYQVAHTTGQLDCYYRRKGESGWTAFGKSTYTSGYAECPEWTKGNHDYDIKLELNGKEHFTDEKTALSKGSYPSAGNLYKTSKTTS